MTLSKAFFVTIQLATAAAASGLSVVPQQQLCLTSSEPQLMQWSNQDNSSSNSSKLR